MPSKQEVSQMANFMRALGSSSESAASVPLTEPARPLSNSSDAAQMKDVLARFYAATDQAVDNIQRDARVDRELREALMTESTTRGSRIGDWEIRVREDDNRRLYSVVQSGSETCIAADLMLYEAARGLVRILNEGGKINSAKAVNLLRFEQDYVAALNDAVVYKHYLVKRPHDKRRNVFEARYSDAKTRAVRARGKLVDLVGQ